MKMRALLFPACFGAWLLALLAGCTFWPKPVTDSFASVTITNTTYADVQAATIHVFRDAGYKLTSTETNSDMMVFDKAGTQGQDAAYSSFLGAKTGAGVVDRVKTVLRNDLGDSTFLVECQAYIVEDSDGAITPQEIQRSNLHSGPYQKMLEKIARQLNPPPAKK